MLRGFPKVAAALLLVAAIAAPARAARPILDYHRLDAYFALYAHDSNVPWKPTSVRLDTFTSAPVQFSVYAVDPADVIVAGANTRPRAVNTSRFKPLAQWQYVPPGGYRFQSNDVDVPLGNREGFFVVEARRGGVGQQVWINRTRVGLISKETPAGIVVYGADLGSGAPLPHMRVSFIAGGRFVDRYTGGNGTVTWRSQPRPVFALASWGKSSSFVSFLPQAPLPGTIVAVKTDTAVVHAGDEVRAVGFARTRTGGRLRAASGSAALALRSYSGTVTERIVPLDRAGSFSVALPVPANARAGDYTVLATVAGVTSGAMVHVDANAGGLSLSVSPQCSGTCDSQTDVPVVVRAVRDERPAAGVDIAVHIIRSPHAYPVTERDEPWGLAQWYDTTVTTGTDGKAGFEIPRPQDGLASTYGVRVSAGGATADTRITVPTTAAVVRVTPERSDIGSGEPAAFDVYATDYASGKPVAGAPVDVRLMHGASVQEQTVQLDDRGHAHGAFNSPLVGANLIVASVQGATDAAEVMVEAQTMQMQSARSGTVQISTDRKTYAAGEQARVEAFAQGANGTAFLTLESANGTDVQVVRVADGHAGASFRVADGAGTIAAGAAFVRDGQMVWSSVPLTVDAPGRPLPATLTLDKSVYAPGAIANAQLDGLQHGSGTIVIRLTRGVPTGSAFFGTAPELLAIGTTATQDTALGDASWHPGVDSTGEHALVQTFLRRSAPPSDLTMTQASTASLYWKVDRSAGDSTDIPVPHEGGTYHLSLLKIDDDGRVSAASAELVVQ